MPHSQNLKRLNSLKDAEKVALLMLNLGENLAADILKLMDKKLAMRVAQAMKDVDGKLKAVPADQVSILMEEVLGEFLDVLKNPSHAHGVKIQRSFSSFQSFFVKEGIWPEGGASNPSLDALEQIDDRFLLAFLQKEHPQTVALILCFCPPDRASRILKEFKPFLQAELICRIATIAKVESTEVESINESLWDFIRSQGGGSGSQSYLNVGGPERLAQMLTTMDAPSQISFLKNLETRDPALKEEVEALMFRFEDLPRLDQATMAELLKSTAKEDWAYALCQSSETLELFIKQHMSDRAWEFLKEDREVLGRVRVSDVQEKQQKILKILKNIQNGGEG